MANIGATTAFYKVETALTRANSEVSKSDQYMKMSKPGEEEMAGSGDPAETEPVKRLSYEEDEERMYKIREEAGIFGYQCPLEQYPLPEIVYRGMTNMKILIIITRKPLSQYTK